MKSKDDKKLKTKIFYMKKVFKQFGKIILPSKILAKNATVCTLNLFFLEKIHKQRRQVRKTNENHAISSVIFINKDDESMPYRKPGWDDHVWGCYARAPHTARFNNTKCSRLDQPLHLI